MIFGQRLRGLREGKKITQKELSKILNVSESAIGMYERGEREPNFETIDKIAAYFNVRTDYLLGRTNDPSPHKKESEVESDFSIAFLGGGKEVLDEEEAEHLERELEMFRAFREKRRKEREGNNKK
ncbi:helix-turn-helix domain-containing protein [Paenibacillus sp. IITD108]|uniref:helix-turn-helix domain-containing protein n=1 Tax=Paenibacillus sp. IITD108 TaxID=3116649 RepID=UPI002F3EEEEB